MAPAHSYTTAYSLTALSPIPPEAKYSSRGFREHRGDDFQHEMIGIFLQEGRCVEYFEASQFTVRPIVGGDAFSKIPAPSRAGLERAQFNVQGAAWAS